MRSIFHHLLGRLEGELPELLPADSIARHQLVSRDVALRRAHFPTDDAPIAEYNEARSPAHRRLIFEEFLWLTLALGLRRGDRSAEPKGAQIEIDDRVRDAVRSILPFTPTSAQKRVIREIVDDMTSDRPMNRLLQGDVGSGKTIVALYRAMAIAIENGYQAALMVPTEILAEQHARNMRRILRERVTGWVCSLAVLRAKEKRADQERIAAGEGTSRRHARADSGGRRV